MTSQYTTPGSSTRSDRILGWWSPEDNAPRTPAAVKALIEDLRRPLWLVERQGRLEVHAPGTGERVDSGSEGLPIVGYVPAMMPNNMGDPSFCSDYGLTYPYLSGSMANGIGSVEIAIAMGRSGMLGFFGAAGLSPARIEDAIDRIQRELGDLPFGVNLIHAPQEPKWEEAAVDLFIKKGVKIVEASAYLNLTPAVVRYRLHGIHEDHLGRIVTPNQIIAKASRIEVATKFFSPPPEKMLAKLVAEGHITEQQAVLARRVPVARDLTAEADSGGHTDNRPALAMLPTMVALRDRLQAEHGFDVPLRIGLAGGIATPSSANAAFSMGAAYVLLGSVHQACLESGTSDTVRNMLAQAQQADITMAPAADMFEMGVNLQVLKRGTMFPMRAVKLYELYRNNPSLEALSSKDREMLEQKVFRSPLDTIWTQTRQFFTERDPDQIVRADRDPKHKMALVFRWYLGKSSSWANAGDASRKIDYQVWCGPAMGAFNEWVRGSFLESVDNRRVVTVAQNILFGSACLTRLNMLRGQGYGVSPELWRVDPRRSEHLKEFFT